MGKHDHDDQLDEVLASLEQARNEPVWVPPEPRKGPRRLLAPPESLDRARWVPASPAIMILLGCAVLAAVILGVRILLDRGGGTVQAHSPSATSTTHAVVSGHGALSSATASASATASIWSIHVVGAVKHPGVVAVSPGARVKDAVAAAGGLAANADSSDINLARVLADGEQVHVPRPGESVAPVASVGVAQSGGSANAAGGMVNLNTADLSGLDSLPGVGPVLAQRILDWRTAHGKFSSVDELGEVSGIGDKALERLRPHVSV